MRLPRPLYQFSISLILMVTLTHFMCELCSSSLRVKEWPTNHFLPRSSTLTPHELHCLLQTCSLQTQCEHQQTELGVNHELLTRNVSHYTQSIDTPTNIHNTHTQIHTYILTHKHTQWRPLHNGGGTVDPQNHKRGLPFGSIVCPHIGITILHTTHT